MKPKYVAPGLTVVSFRNERGFAASGNPIDNMANWINNQAEKAFDQDEAWLATQDVSGFGSGQEDDYGMQAGYFSDGSTDGWF